MQSVLEIATNVCRSAGEAGGPARGPAPPRARDGRGEGPDDRLRRHASVREVGGAADRRAAALPRDRRRAALRRPPGAAVRPARARRHRRPREGDPRRERDAGPPSDPARAVDQLALLARRADRPDVDPHADLQDLSARRHPAPLRELGRLSSRGSSSWSRRRRSRTTPTSGGTCARTPTSARSRSGCATRRPGSSTRSRSPR